MRKGMNQREQNGDIRINNTRKDQDDAFAERKGVLYMFSGEAVLDNAYGGLSEYRSSLRI